MRDAPRARRVLLVSVFIGQHAFEPLVEHVREREQLLLSRQRHTQREQLRMHLCRRRHSARARESKRVCVEFRFLRLQLSGLHLELVARRLLWDGPAAEEGRHLAHHDRIGVAG